MKMIYGSGLIALSLLVPALAAEPAANATAPKTAKSADARSLAAQADYVPLGATAFGPNGHGSYAWFVDSRNQQVVMCQVHNPQTPIECKRTPLPAP